MRARRSTISDVPHTVPEELINRYPEQLMRPTHQNPALMTGLVKGAGVVSAALMTAPLWLQTFGVELSGLAAVGAAVAGGVGLAASGFNWFLQNHFFGLPLNQAVADDASDQDKAKNTDDIHAKLAAKASPYRSSVFSFKSARGEMIMEKNTLPRLKITADRHYDAGFVEGYMLAAAIRDNLVATGFLDFAAGLGGAPFDLKKMKVKYGQLNKYLADVIKMIPEEYVDEMRGKVEGYNEWLREFSPGTPLLDTNHYLLLQLLPDFLNYNPFKPLGVKTGISVPNVNTPACTTAVLRLGDYSFVMRVLDWPAYNVAGKFFLQIDRKIGNALRFVDVAIPPFSGALTALNEKGVFLEMNVSHGEKVKNVSGIPAVFFNRLCAETATSVDDIEKLIDFQNPLGPYHLTVSDGENVKSFHFYQNPENLSEHHVESLSGDDHDPRLMVVANAGLHHEDGKITTTNHCDSWQRKANIFHFFGLPENKKFLADKMAKQGDHRELGPDDLRELNEFMLNIARLPLVSTCKSVLCALYVYRHHELVQAVANSDNGYAGEAELSSFKQIAML